MVDACEAWNASLRCLRRMGLDSVEANLVSCWALVGIEPRPRLQ